MQKTLKTAFYGASIVLSVGIVTMMVLLHATYAVAGNDPCVGTAPVLERSLRPMPRPEKLLQEAARSKRPMPRPAKLLAEAFARNVAAAMKEQ